MFMLVQGPAAERVARDRILDRRAIGRRLRIVAGSGPRRRRRSRSPPPRCGSRGRSRCRPTADEFDCTAHSGASMLPMRCAWMAPSAALVERQHAELRAAEGVRDRGGRDTVGITQRAEHDGSGVAVTVTVTLDSSPSTAASTVGPASPRPLSSSSAMRALAHALFGGFIVGIVEVQLLRAGKRGGIGDALQRCAGRVQRRRIDGKRRAADEQRRREGEDHRNGARLVANKLAAIETAPGDLAWPCRTANILGVNRR